jgi:hypothetical protein
MPYSPMTILMPPVTLFCTLTERSDHLKLVGILRDQLKAWVVKLDLARDHPRADTVLDVKFKGVINADDGILFLWTEDCQTSPRVLEEYAFATSISKRRFLLLVPDWRGRFPA